MNKSSYYFFSNDIGVLLYEKLGDTDDIENSFSLFSSLMTSSSKFSFSTKLDVNGYSSLDVDGGSLDVDSCSSLDVDGFSTHFYRRYRSTMIINN